MNLNSLLITLRLKEQAMTLTKKTKFVGISLDEFLNWNQRIHNINNKIFSTLYALNQIRKILPEKTVKTIYISILQLDLQYSIITQGNAIFKDLEPIILKQKKNNQIPV